MPPPPMPPGPSGAPFLVHLFCILGKLFFKSLNIIVRRRFRNKVVNLGGFLKPNPDADDIGIVHRFRDLEIRGFGRTIVPQLISLTVRGTIFGTFVLLGIGKVCCNL